MERCAIFRVLVLSVVFLFLKGESKLEILTLTTSNHRLSNYKMVQKASSRVIKSYVSSSISSPSRRSARVACYVHCRANVHDNSPTKRYRSCFIAYNPPHSSHASTVSTTRFFAQNDATESKSIQQDKSASVFDSNLPLNARHWFTQLLPEGWCVGVCTDDESSTVSDDLSLHSTISLHPDEYQWGLDNIASVNSRTSYYLGRMALRLSIDALLQHERMDVDSQEKQTFCTQLNENIRSTAINKDSYGRPILPEIISGSISHKGGNAVGLARFRSSWDNQSEMGNIQLGTLDAGAIQWREECPILEDGEEADRDVIDGISCASSASTVRGIGIDLERIDAKRGKRIERKVLTETEQVQLGGLEVSALAVKHFSSHIHLGLCSSFNVILLSRISVYPMQKKWY